MLSHPFVAHIEFQTNPCGVEAVESRNTIAVNDWFQTNPCGVEATGQIKIDKHKNVFQTNPCGVEASTLGPPSGKSYCFRRTLVGLKLVRAGAHAIVDEIVSDEPLWG